MKTNTSRILWLDCLGGISVGLIVLSLAEQLSTWEGLPFSIMIFMGIANLTYGSFSLFVTLSKNRKIVLVKALSLANMAWLLVCFVVASVWWTQITGLGLFHVFGEGVYVAGLGILEWRLRHQLSNG